jgi:hypothetical protein
MGAMKDKAIELMEMRKSASLCPDCGNPSQNGEVCQRCLEDEFWGQKSFDDLSEEDENGWD